MVIRIFFLVMVCFSPAVSQQVEIIKFPELRDLINSQEPDVHVINFWATWCGPCVKELPQFEALHQKNKPGLKVTLISLDFADRVDRVARFLHRKKMTANTLLLDEIDGNTWIDKVEPAWSGAIPATLILDHRTGKRKFIEKELKDGELESLIEEFIRS
jgi:thiol-disulfide isomerase/thioredoxin